MKGRVQFLVASRTDPSTRFRVDAYRPGFEELGLDNVVSFTLPSNDASRRVMEKLGFCYEKNCWYAELPHVLYRLTK